MARYPLCVFTTLIWCLCNSKNPQQPKEVLKFLSYSYEFPPFFSFRRDVAIYICSLNKKHPSSYRLSPFFDNFKKFFCLQKKFTAYRKIYSEPFYYHIKFNYSSISAPSKSIYTISF